MEPILRMENITKRFPGVNALDDVSISIEKGEIHGLVGENGAGKSTLIKILSGAYAADNGKIYFNGESIDAKEGNPSQMIKKGIAVIYQEFMLAPHLTVAENVYLGKQTTNKAGLIDYKTMAEETKKECQKIGLELDPKTKVCNLSVAKKQMVEIIKALSRNAKLIVLDEPTAVLGENELKGMFDIVKELAKQGVSFIYISHRLKEVFEIAHKVTIMKDGKVVATDDIRNYDINKLISGMVGRPLQDIYPSRNYVSGKPILEVKNLHAGDKIRDISFKLHEGEILAISGLAGAGRSEIIRTIFGADKYDDGEIFVYGEKVRPKTPAHGIKKSIGLLPEDRKVEGLFLKQTIKYNVGIVNFREFAGKLFINLKKEKLNTNLYIEKINIKPQNPNMTVKKMSGGNQQKVVFSKWMNAKCRILLIDEPTRGVDVGAKQEIYRLINTLTSQGYSIIMVSSELPEVLGLSDRVLVIWEGRLTAELDSKKTTEEEIMQYATGQKVQEV